MTGRGEHEILYDNKISEREEKSREKYIKTNDRLTKRYNTVILDKVIKIVHPHK